MAIIAYLIKIYFFRVFTDNKLILTYTFFIVAAAYNGYIFADIAKKLDPNIVLNIGSISLFVLTVIRKFFPFLSYFSKPAKNYYPLNGIQRFTVNFIDDSLLSVYFVATAIFLLFFYQFGSIPVKDFGILPISVFIGYTFRRSVQCLVFQKIFLENIFWICTFFTVSILIYLILFYYYKKLILPYCYLLAMVSLVITFLIEEKFTSAKLCEQNNTKVFLNTYQQLLWGNKKFKLWSCAWILLKIIFLTVISVGFSIKNKYPPLFIIILFSSPLMLFNYILNNFFGFFDTYWLSLEKAFLTGRKVFKHFMILSKWVIIIDVMIVVVFASFNSSITSIIIYAYIGTLPLMTVLSFYWSVLFPKKVQQTLFNTEPAAAAIPIIVSFIICCSFTLLSVNPHFKFIGIGYFILSLILLKGINNFYKSYRIYLYQKLFRK